MELRPSHPSIALMLHGSSGTDECLVIRNVENMAHLCEWTAEELLQKVSICVILVGSLVTGWQMQGFQLYRHIPRMSFGRGSQACAISFIKLLLLLLLFMIVWLGMLSLMLTS